MWASHFGRNRNKLYTTQKFTLYEGIIFSNIYIVYSHHFLIHLHCIQASFLTNGACIYPLKEIHTKNNLLKLDIAVIVNFSISIKEY